MRGAPFLLVLLMAAALPAAAQDGWQQAQPEKSAPPPLRSDNAPAPTPRPDPAAEWQQAPSKVSSASTTPPLRADAALPTPRPEPAGEWQKAASNTPSGNSIPPLRSDQMPTPRPDPSAGWQQATTTVAANRASPPPQLRRDGPAPTPRPDPQAGDLAKTSYPGGISATFGVAYQPGGKEPAQTLDLYQPRPRSYPLPLVVFLHGAGRDSRHAAVFPDLPATMAGLAAQGYVVASVNYRGPEAAKFPAAVQDVKAAIRFLRGHANDMGLDTTRVALWGISAGGQLAALAGLSCGVPLFASGAEDCVQAVVDWYGPVAATGYMAGCDPAGCAPGIARTADPLSYVSFTSPPVLIEQGEADTLAPLAASQKLQAALKDHNVAADLVSFPNLGHDFSRDGNPDAGATRQALQKMAAFLATVFPPGAIGGAKVKPAGRGSVY